MSSYYPAQPPAQQAPVQTVHYAPQTTNPADSVGAWMLTLFICAIPLVGFIYLLVVAFGGSASESRKNWARAQFIWMLIGVVLSIIFLALGGLTLFQGTSSSSYGY